MGKESNHLVTVEEMFVELQKLQPKNPIKISTANKVFTILSIYEADDTVWIDVEEE